MLIIELTNSVKNKLKDYFSWETDFDFSGWEDIEMFFGETLVDAWIKARPNDIDKFNDSEFTDLVLSANGKWLEKQFEEDSYKIIVATNRFESVDEMCIVIAHELRHCLDYQNAVNGLNFENYEPGNTYYNNWSEFRAVSVSVRFDIFQKLQSGSKDFFSTLASTLGCWSTDCVEGLMNANNYRDELYFISRYVGASRAIQNLNKKFSVGSTALYLWQMAPTYITENYGLVFYIGNEWSRMESCSLDVTPEENYYNDLLMKLKK